MTILALLFLLIPSVAMADYITCTGPGGTVTGRAQFANTATSTTAKAVAPGQAISAGAAADSFTDRGSNNWEASYAVSATPTFGLWSMFYEATVNGATVRGMDTFEVKPGCPISVVTEATPTTTVLTVTGDPITADNDFLGFKLFCEIPTTGGSMWRYITKTVASTDAIHVEYGNPFPVAPGTGDTCSIEKP